MLEKTNSHGYVVREDGQVTAPSRRVLRPSLQRNGRLTVGCKQDEKWVTRYVHQLVCEAFHGPRPEGMVTRHLDGDPLNNHASNLKWGTQLENETDKDLHGRRPINEQHKRSKLTSGQVEELRWAARWGKSYADLGRQYGISAEHASRIVKRTRRTR